MRDSLRIAAIIFGVIAVAGGIILGFVLAVMAFMTPRETWLLGLTVAVSAMTVGIGLGSVLALAGWSSWRRRPSPALELPPLWWLAAALALILGIGHLLLQTSASWLLPPWHVLAALLPPLMVTALLLPALQPAGLTQRTVLASFAYGGVLATLVGIVLEMGMLVLVLVLAAVGAAAWPGGAAGLSKWESILRAVETSGDPAALSQMIVLPVVVGVGLLLAGAVPLIEEVVKSLGSLAFGAPRGPRARARVFMTGVMAGAGFSFTEALFYAAQLLPEQWVPNVLLRGLTVVVHAAATGLFALGWYEVRSRSPLGALRYLLAGFAIHGLWNGLSGLLAVVGLRASGAPGGLTTASLVLVVGGLALLWIAALAALLWERRRLSRGLGTG